MKRPGQVRRRRPTYLACCTCPPSTGGSSQSTSVPRLHQLEPRAVCRHRPSPELYLFLFSPSCLRILGLDSLTLARSDATDKAAICHLPAAVHLEGHLSTLLHDAPSTSPRPNKALHVPDIVRPSSYKRRRLESGRPISIDIIPPPASASASAIQHQHRHLTTSGLPPPSAHWTRGPVARSAACAFCECDWLAARQTSLAEVVSTLDLESLL